MYNRNTVVYKPDTESKIQSLLFTIDRLTERIEKLERTKVDKPATEWGKYNG